MANWTEKLIGPVLSIVTFFGAYYLDLASLSSNSPSQISAIPAFLLSVVVLLICHLVSTTGEVSKMTIQSKHMEQAVKNHLHIVEIGSPEFALEYIHSRIASLREVKNTSFNLSDEIERSNEKFYDSPIYTDLSIAIQSFTKDRLIWKDVGDRYAVDRFRKTKRGCIESKYTYRLINHCDPQINFILIEYKNGDREVLFNWDFRKGGEDPIVLLSREPKLLSMFSCHFDELWRKASQDHDFVAIDTRSTS